MSPFVEVKSSRAGEQEVLTATPPLTVAALSVYPQNPVTEMAPEPVASDAEPRYPSTVMVP